MKIKHYDIIKRIKSINHFEFLRIIHHFFLKFNYKLIFVSIPILCIFLLILNSDSISMTKLIIFILCPITILVDCVFNFNSKTPNYSLILLVEPSIFILSEIIILTIYQVRKKYKLKRFDPGISTQMAIHNFRNLLFAISGYIDIGNLKKAKQTIFEINDTLNIQDMTVLPSHLEIIINNNIIFHKKLIAKKQNIKLNSQVNIKHPLCIKETDLCNIIGNILDNSIEACNKINDPNKKIITLKIYTLDNSLHIFAENFMPQSTDKLNFKTTKANKEVHGLGLKSIDKLVNKYNGHKFLDPHDDIFSIKIILPSIIDYEKYA